MVPHRDNPLPAIKESARIVATLLNIWRNGGAPKRRTHLLSNRMDAALEDRELNRTLRLIHACTSITRLPRPSTLNTSPKGRIVAELYSETIAGPAKVSPGRRRSRL